ncbi:MAG TPA: DUF4272 domain-containing protein [Thermomicrobiales bacterium]|nr:DUF4272 domain-containing protein [Thermomicrobiales bacterium]
MDEESIDIQLRPPTVVAERCIVLASLVRRLWIESSLSVNDPGDWSAEAFDLREWLRAEGIWESLTPAEGDFLQRPAGDLAEDEIAVIAWQAEGLATLGWALRLTTLLPPGVLGDITAVVQAVPAPWDDTAAWTRSALLRSESEIATERDRAEIHEWRIAIEGPRRLSSKDERREYEAAIADVVREARMSRLLESDCDDFVVGDRLIASFNDLDLERFSSLAEERLRALNWLCGFGTSWDEVPLDI